LESIRIHIVCIITASNLIKDMYTLTTNKYLLFNSPLRILFFFVGFFLLIRLTFKCLLLLVVVQTHTHTHIHTEIVFVCDYALIFLRLLLLLFPIELSIVFMHLQQRHLPFATSTTLKCELMMTNNDGRQRMRVRTATTIRTTMLIRV